MDRHWPSELVYHKVMRPDLVRMYDHEALRKRIRELNGVYVLCVPTPSSVSLNKVMADVDPVKYADICSEYMDLFAKMNTERFDCFIYNRDHWQNNVESAVKMIRSFNYLRP
jgi:hypothetical protein